MTQGPPPPFQPLELSPAHMEALRRLVAEGFEVVRFQYFESQVGLRRGDCAALLAPQPDGTFRLASAPTVLVEGHLSARVDRGGEDCFVWKSHQLRVTPELKSSLQRFESGLRALLDLPTSPYTIQLFSVSLWPI